VKLLRTLSTRHLIVLAVAVMAVALGGTAIAVAAGGGSGATPPPKPLAQAIHDALAAPASAGVTAKVRFINRLFPSGSLLGGNASALMSGATGRLWLTNDGRGRLELQSDAGDVQVVWNKTKVTAYDASSNTVYSFDLPAATTDSSPPDNGATPSLTQIGDFLSKLGQHADVSAAQPADIAGRPAYNVKISPKHDGGLLGYAELAWDAEQGVPLRVAVYAQGSSKPVLELAATDISYGSVPSSAVDVAPPAGAKTVDLSGVTKPETGAAKTAAATGLAAVQAAVDFPVIAPDTLVGLPRQDVRTVGGNKALVTYGQGLGAIVVVERKADAAGTPQNGAMSALPSVSLDGLTGHELATQLGTAIEWQRNGVSFVLAGSLPPAAAESAARALK
jgi:outer membrane lipoprotein-sorting protein